MRKLINKSIAMTAIALAVVGCSDELPDETGNSFGQLAFTGTATVGETLTATVTDGNGVDGSAISYNWMADDVTIAGASSNTFVLTEDQAGSRITVTASYTDNDNYQELLKSNATTAVVSLNPPTTFSGLTAAVFNDASEAITGTIVIVDADEGESIAEVQTDVMTTFGTFSIAESGEWSYLLDTSNATVASLMSEDDRLTDTITVYSIDGSMAELVITIMMAEEVEASQAAKITDNMDDDAGELRYKLESSDVIPAGKISVSFLKEAGIEKDAYIGLYGSSTSTSNALIDLRIQSTGYVIRNNDGVDITIPFTEDKWTDVEMTWDTTTGSAAPLLTVTIDGTSVTTDAFESVSQSLSDVAAGVQYVIFKLGDNGSTIGEPAFYVDNFMLYSDVAGTTVHFEDDFESYSIDDSLDTDNAASPYNSSSAEVVVALVEPTVPDNQIAKITDNMDDDAGELRYKLESSDVIPAGKISVSFLKEAGIEKDAYIGLFGSSTSTSNAMIDLRIQSTGYVIRNNDDIDITIPFTADKWTDVEMTWDTTTGSAAPMLTVTIDGTSVTTDAFESVSQSLSDVASGVQYVIFKLGDNGSTVGEPAYYVDDFKLYSDTEGTTIHFEDDFEGYSVDDSLDTDNDASPYNSSSAEVIVVKEGS